MNSISVWPRDGFGRGAARNTGALESTPSPTSVPQTLRYTAYITQSPVPPAAHALSQPPGMAKITFLPAWQPLPSCTTLGASTFPAFSFANSSAIVNAPLFTVLFPGVDERLNSLRNP